MKKVMLTVLFFCLLDLAPSVFAAQCNFDTIISNLPHQLPYDDGTNIWTDVTIFNPDCSSSVYLIYSKSGSTMEFSAFGSGFPSTLKSQWSSALWYLSTNSGNSWINYGVGSSFASGNDEWGVGSKYPYHEWKSTQDLYFNYSGGMNFYWNGVTYWHLGQTSHGQKILNASSFAGGGSYQLTVNLNPSTGGTVTSSPGSLTCSNGACTGSFSGDVQLTASAADGWEFAHWVYEGNNDTTNPKTINVNAAKEIKAVFKLLSFPLAGYNAYNVPVSSAFDHTGTAQYEDTDHQVMTFKGEASEVQTPYSGTTCYPKSDNSAFGLGFNYDGISGAGVYYLCYNGHPGYDYLVNTVDVYSAASGTVKAASNDSCLGNYVEIEHTGGFTTKYFHLSSIDTNNVQVDQHINAGVLIGVSGNTGTCSSGYHLHFQVNNPEGIPVDPYGWEGSGSDSYTRAVNYDLWK